MERCPQCGYRENPAPNERHNIMNYYYGSNGVSGFMNRQEKEFVVGEGDKAVNWVRRDVYDKAMTDKAAQEPKKAASAPAPQQQIQQSTPAPVVPTNAPTK
jgi:hypothetical protein